MKKRGFTLIELLVVIAIIGILSGIVIAGLDKARQSARDTRRVADIKNLQLALQLYYVDQSIPQYPVTLASLVPIYINAIPSDPSSGSYIYTAYNANGSISCTSIPVSIYHLGANMEVSDSSLVTGSDDRDDATLLVAPYGKCTGSGAHFHGKAAGCSGSTAAANDDCFDVMP